MITLENNNKNREVIQEIISHLSMENKTVNLKINIKEVIANIAEEMVSLISN